MIHVPLQEGSVAEFTASLMSTRVAEGRIDCYDLADCKRRFDPSYFKRYPVPFPQNIIALIGEVVEKTVLLRLALLTAYSPLQAFRNVSWRGQYLRMINEETGGRIRLEVKARKRHASKQKNSNRVSFYLSDHGRKFVDFLNSVHLQEALLLCGP